jgi:hypothetical protein
VRLQIAQIGEEVLRRPANQLSREDILSAKTQELIEHMRDTMCNAPGVGLVARKSVYPCSWRPSRTVRNITRSSVPRDYPRGKGNRFHFTSLLILGLFRRTTQVSNSLRAA